MKFFVLDKVNGNILFTNATAECLSCFAAHKDENYIRIECPLNEGCVRLGEKESGKYFFYLCTDETQTKTSKLFREKLEMLSYCVPSMMEFKDEVEATVKRKEMEKYSKVVHNLKTLNAQNIYTQYNFISQDAFAENYRNQFEFVMNEVKRNPREATIALLKQAKNNAHMKTEFTSHEKLAMENPSLFGQNHVMRKVILNVYHSFDMEFKEKGVDFRITASDERAFFDYDTIRLALYHILSNAVKYIAKNSTLNVVITPTETKLGIDFQMQSFYIKPNERENIFEDNYSGEVVLAYKLQGQGLGMGLIRKAITMNNGQFIVIAGEKNRRNDFANNIFRIILPKHKQ